MSDDLGSQPHTCSCGDVVAIGDRYYRMGEPIHQGNDSRIHSAELIKGGCGSAFVVKYYICRRGSEAWIGAMKEIEAALKLKKCRYTVRLRDYSIRETGGGICEIFLLMDRLCCCTEVFGCRRAEERRIIELCVDILHALSFMRRKGLVHGDVKPSNIYYTESDGWKLGDFGSVMKIGERPKFVSEGYCSPEARRGGACDIRSDVYSLGITAYKLLSGGRIPFCDKPCELLEDGEVYRAIERRLSGEPIPPIDGVSERLNKILLKMCEYDPARRFAGVSALVLKLEGLKSNYTDWGN